MSDEAIAFFTTMAKTARGQSTACAGWTAHELFAHVAAGAAEMARVITRRLDGDPSPDTRGFGPREAPYRALRDTPLRDRLAAEGVELLRALDALEQRPDTVVPFTGWAMTAAQLRMHARSEMALHRWDLAGDDDTSVAILSAPELTRHAVDSLTTFTSLREAPATRARLAGVLGHEPGHELEVRLRCDGTDDVVARIGDGTASLRIAAPTEGPHLELNPAARLLLLWGRRSALGHARRGSASSEQVALLERWLVQPPSSKPPSG